MSAGTIPDAALPPDVEAYLGEVMRERAHPLLLRFDAHWQLLQASGDAALYGIDPAQPAPAASLFADLFVGVPAHGNHEIRFVELPNQRSAHVHLLHRDDGFDVLLLDVTEERDRQRDQQQLGNEEVLASGEKSKAIGQLQQIRGELERQRARLEEADALKNALISTLSHDFRTPLTSIFGYLHLLERGMVHDARSTQALGAVRRNATFLFTLAENLLEYGRGDADETLLSPSRVDLATLARDMDAMFRPLAQDKQLDFDVALDLDQEAEGRYDEIRVRRILINLLSNAVRYTNHGRIDLAITRRGGRLRLVVRDTGIGIADEFQAAVFTPFNRGAQSGSKGAGLGLSIVKRLVAQMHGRLGFQSQTGQGSCFTIELAPIVEAVDGLDEAPDADDAWALAGRSVLVVDDDPDVAQLLDVLLADLGFRVRVVGNAQGALDEVLREAPDILLIDVGLPGLSGNAAVFKLRARGYAGRIVTLSAAATSEARDAALRAGADLYLTKPLNVEQFMRAMRHGALAARAG